MFLIGFHFFNNVFIFSKTRKNINLRQLFKVFFLMWIEEKKRCFLSGSCGVVLLFRGVLFFCSETNHAVLLCLFQEFKEKLLFFSGVLQHQKEKKSSYSKKSCCSFYHQKEKKSCYSKKSWCSGVEHQNIRKKRKKPV